MPYKLVKDKGEYYVENTDTGERKNKEPLSRSRAVAYMRALYAVEKGTMKEVKLKRDFDPNTGGGVDRDKLDDSDFVDPDGRRFPIVKPSDISDAVSSFGRAKPVIPYDKFKSRVISIAKRKGKSFMDALPQAWKDEMDSKEISTKAPPEGHEFYGNQWTGGGGGGGSSESDNIHEWSGNIIEHENPLGRNEALTKIRNASDSNNLSSTDREYLRIVARNQEISFDNTLRKLSGNPRIGRNGAKEYLGRAARDWHNKGVIGFGWDKEGNTYYSTSLKPDDIPATAGNSSKELDTGVFVFKQDNGVSRWVTFSSNAYKDRDHEIVSTAALESDVERADKDGDYGPLRWWHIGSPDPLARQPGRGVDIGKCDYNAMHGRILVESGTFSDERIAQAVKESARDLQVSIGFFHPRNEPDSNGVFSTIRRFERSLLPRGRASNPWTSMVVIQKDDEGGELMLKEKIKALFDLLQSEELVQMVLDKAEQTEKQAESAGVEFKGENPPPENEKPVEVEAEKADKTEPKPVAEVEIEEPEPEEVEPVIGDMTPDEFSGMMAAALAKALEPYTKELRALKTAQAKKDDEAALMKEALELQAGTITALKAQIDELTGSQPRAANKGYRASQAEETVVKETSRVKGQKPTVDPDFLSFALGKQG